MTEILVQKGDITKIKTNVIVNAANSLLLGGGGVDGAIHKAGGEEIMKACREIRARQGGCATGEAVITFAGKLPSNFVIHTVGPVWNDKIPEEIDRLLSNCYKNSLSIATENKIQSIAFPNISTGIYRFPKKKAAEIAIKATIDYLGDKSLIEKVIFVCFDDENFEIYSRLLTEKTGY
ncbi:MAG: O-acetyl-ADP-ribose deacetylase [Bacteroidetes bacterium]|nr:O-acetyl-ADP-ribose deacetylase [Bacteroidota bacterium]